jgi:hypothetical protein
MYKPTQPTMATLLSVINMSNYGALISFTLYWWSDTKITSIFFYLFGTACVTHDYLTAFLLQNAAERRISGWIIQHTSIFSVCWETDGEPDIFHSKSSKLSTNLGGEQASQTTIQEMRRRVSMVTRRPPSSTPGQSLVKPLTPCWWVNNG